MELVRVPAPYMQLAVRALSVMAAAVVETLACSRLGEEDSPGSEDNGFIVAGPPQWQD